MGSDAALHEFLLRNLIVNILNTLNLSFHHFDFNHWNKHNALPIMRNFDFKGLNNFTIVFVERWVSIEEIITFLQQFLGILIIFP